MKSTFNFCLDVFLSIGYRAAKINAILRKIGQIKFFSKIFLISFLRRLNSFFLFLNIQKRVRRSHSQLPTHASLLVSMACGKFCDVRASCDKSLTPRAVCSVWPSGSVLRGDMLYTELRLKVLTLLWITVMVFNKAGKCGWFVGFWSFILYNTNMPSCEMIKKKALQRVL